MAGRKTHKTFSKERQHKDKQPWSHLYNLQRWRTGRERHLKIYPLCVKCEALGTITAANTVDHIKAHRGNDHLFFDETNWQSLCASCHSKKTTAETRSNANYPSAIHPHRSTIVIVSGPPGSGRSTWCQQQAGLEDYIIDMDHLMSELSGLPLYQCEHEEWYRRALVQRNSILETLHKRTWKTVYLIVSAPTGSERAKLKATLNAARVVVIEADYSVCHDRIVSEKDVRLNYKQRLRDAEKWWTCYSTGRDEETVRNFTLLTSA